MSPPSRPPPDRDHPPGWPLHDRPHYDQPPPDDSPTRALPRPAPGLVDDAGPGRHSRRRPTGPELVGKLRGHLPFLAVSLVVAVAFWRIALHHWREGAAEIGVALIVAAVLRARLPSREAAGLLAVRGRRVDVVTYALAGSVLILVALTITGGPLATR